MLVVTASVLLGHWALLANAPLALASHPEPNASAHRPFTTRTIVIAPTATTTAPRATAAQAASAGPTPTRKRNQRIASPTTEPDFRQSSMPFEPVARVDTAQAATETIAKETPPESSDVELAALNSAPEVAAGAQTPEPVQAPEAPQAQATPTHSYAIPGSVRLKYDIRGEIKGIPYFVNGELLWLHDGKTYDARTEISHFFLGSRVQTSKGTLTAQGLEPLRFGDKVRSEVAAHFERHKGKVSFSANTPDAPLTPGAQDQLSVFVQLASLLGGDPNQLPAGSSIGFQAVGARSSELWVFKVGQWEQLVLPGGTLKALKLTKDPADEGGVRAELWLAPDLGNLPARIRLTQSNGDFVDQQWRATQKP